jgi:hypothetical protein
VLHSYNDFFTYSSLREVGKFFIVGVSYIGDKLSPVLLPALIIASVVTGANYRQCCYRR